jgi:hypothetical protein
MDRRVISPQPIACPTLHPQRAFAHADSPHQAYQPELGASVRIESRFEELARHRMFSRRQACLDSGEPTVSRGDIGLTPVDLMTFLGFLTPSYLLTYLPILRSP